MHGPLDESNFHCDLRLYPVRTHAWQALGYGEWRFRDLEFVELFAEIQQQFRIESGSDPSRTSARPSGPSARSCSSPACGW